MKKNTASSSIPAVNFSVILKEIERIYAKDHKYGLYGFVTASMVYVLVLSLQFVYHKVELWFPWGVFPERVGVAAFCEGRGRPHHL